MSNHHRQPRLLLVEDSPTQAEATREVLTAAGYAVTIAASGQAALTLMESATDGFDAVISDIVMPGPVDGFELCRRIKARSHGHLPVVLLTSLAEPLDIIRGLECGADNFFTKPYDPPHLIERLALLLATHRIRRTDRVHTGVQVAFLGKTFTISSEREQILDLLISTFENAVRQNRELQARSAELEAAKAELASRAAAALRESEQRYRGLFENAPLGLSSATPDGTILEANPALVALLGYPSRERVLALKARELWMDQADGAHFIAALERDGLVRGYSARLRRADGTPVDVELTCRAVRDATGRIERIGNAVVDVTERKRLEQQLIHAQKMEAVGRLAGGVAHDFNNVLTVIMSYAQLLREDVPGSDPRADDLDQVVDAVKRAQRLTRQLLAFSRQQVLNPVVTDPRDVIGGVERLLRRLVGEDVELELQLKPAGAVRADVGQLEQVLMNLAANARDAMPAGGRLTISTAALEADGDTARLHGLPAEGAWVVITVADTGTGMTPEVQARLFEPFFTTKDIGHGTGLGLATVHGIVNQSGGHVKAYSEPGRGSTFRVYLPRVAEPPAGAAARAEAPIPRGTETILVAEDDPAVRSAAAAVLVRHGYTVLVARHGEEALARADAHKGAIQLVMTDVAMPGMDGAALAERLRVAHPEVKVLFASGYAGEEIRRRGVLTSGVPFIEKPFTAGDLARKVREVLDAPRSSPATAARSPQAAVGHAPTGSRRR